MKQDPKMIVKGAELILKGLGIDLTEPDFIDTPLRISNSLLKYIAPKSFFTTALKHLSVTFPTRYKGPITMKNMRAKSMCPHHLLPIIYHANLTYIPKEHMVVGSSKPYLFLQDLARLPILQEELTQLYGETFDSIVQPLGLSFELKGSFFCYENDGIHSDDAEMSTSYKSGVFLEENASQNK